MPTIIEADSADELFIKIAKEMQTNGVKRYVRGLNTIEINDAWLILNNPEKHYVELKEREMNYDYLLGETEWYASGSLRVEDIAKYSSFWNSLADPNGTVNSNYGFLINLEKHAGKSQFEWCYEALKKDKYTRQAIMNYNQPKHKYPGVKDFVCTISQTFIVREEALDSIVLMRSNDLIYGLTYDLPWFTQLQINMAGALKLPVGKYHHYDTSLHVYERHFDMLKAISEAEV
jgi:thymidylate synthase